MYSNQKPAEWLRLMADLEHEGADLSQAELNLAHPCASGSACAICYPDQPVLDQIDDGYDADRRDTDYCDRQVDADDAYADDVRMPRFGCAL